MIRFRFLPMVPGNRTWDDDSPDRKLSFAHLEAYRSPDLKKREAPGDGVTGGFLARHPGKLGQPRSNFAQ